MLSLSRAVLGFTALSRVALAAPIQQRQSSDCVDGVTRIYTPDLFNIYYYNGVPEFPSTSTVINVMNGSTSGSAQHQVARFANLSVNAESCTFGWSQAADRSFGVYDNGLVRFSQLTGLPAGNVTASTIEPFQSEDAKGGSIDFTFWPESAGPEDHVGGSVDCGAEVVILLTKDMVSGGPGSVTMEQNQGNGLWLEHAC